MRYKAIFAVTAILLCFSVVAESKQNSTSVASTPAGSPSVITEPVRDCSPGSPQALPTTANVTDEAPSAVAPPAIVHLDEDLKLLTERQSTLAQCIVAMDPQALEQDSQGACFGQLLVNFEMRHDGDPERDIPIGRLRGSSAFFYESGMTIDADGAPNAYHPDNTGLDDLANAGTPGRWEGLAKDPYGEPYIQGPDDPYPGYYVSSTALADRSKPPNDPTRYVDASKIPFIVLPGGMARQLGARPGDFVAVFNQRNGKSSYAIFGDVGPFDRIGKPQKPFINVADQITGSVLDAGCGTGDNALFLASRGNKVTGIDFLEVPIQRAKRKAKERGVSATFLVKDAMTFKDWSERFDCVIDCGLFHIFSDDDRKRYVAGLATVLKPGGRLFLMCFSDEEPGTRGLEECHGTRSRVPLPRGGWSSPSSQ